MDVMDQLFKQKIMKYVIMNILILQIMLYVSLI